MLTPKTHPDGPVRLCMEHAGETAQLVEGGRRGRLLKRDRVVVALHQAVLNADDLVDGTDGEAAHDNDGPGPGQAQDGQPRLDRLPFDVAHDDARRLVEEALEPEPFHDEIG